MTLVPMPGHLRTDLHDPLLDPDGHIHTGSRSAWLMLAKAKIHRVTLRQTANSMRKVTDLSPDTTEICECCGKVAAGQRPGVFESLEDWWVLGSDVLDWVNWMHLFIKVLFVLSLAAIGLMVFMNSIGEKDHWVDIEISSSYPFTNVTNAEFTNADLVFWHTQDSITDQPSNCTSLNSPKSTCPPRRVVLRAFPCVISLFSILLGLYFFYHHSSKVQDRDGLLASGQPSAALVTTVDTVLIQILFPDKILEVIPVYESREIRQTIKNYKSLKEKILKKESEQDENPVFFKRIWRKISCERELSGLYEDLAQCRRDVVSGNVYENPAPNAYILMCSDLITARILEVSQGFQEGKCDGRPFRSLNWENMKIVGCCTEWLYDILEGFAIFIYLVIFIKSTRVQTASLDGIETFLIVISVNFLLKTVVEVHNWLFGQMTIERGKAKKMSIYILLEVLIWLKSPKPLIIIGAKIAFEHCKLTLEWLFKEYKRYSTTSETLKSPFEARQKSINATFQGLEMDVCALYCFDGPLFAYASFWFSKYPSAALFSFLGMTTHYILIRFLMKYEYKESYQTQVFNHFPSRIGGLQSQILLPYAFIFLTFLRLESFNSLIRMRIFVPALGEIITEITFQICGWGLVIFVMCHLTTRMLDSGEFPVSWNPFFSYKISRRALAAAALIFPSVTLTEQYILNLMDKDFDQERIRAIEFYNSLRLTCAQVSLAHGEDGMDWDLMEKLMLRVPKSMKEDLQELEIRERK